MDLYLQYSNIKLHLIMSNELYILLGFHYFKYFIKIHKKDMDDETKGLFQKCNTTQFSFSCALFVFKNMNIDRYCALLQ